MKYGYSSKLGPKATKPALESSFYLKIENESNRLIGMVGMIEPLSSILSPASNSRKSLKKSWDDRFCDHLEIVILSVDLHWLLKDVEGAQKIKPFPALRLSQKHTRISENGKQRFQSFSRWLHLVKKIFDLEAAKGYNFKFSKGKMDLVTYAWKDPSTTRPFFLLFFFF